MQRLTKSEIMAKIISQASKENVEVTPSYIRKYLMEVVGVSKPTAFRFIRAQDDQLFKFEPSREVQKRAPRKKISIEINKDEYIDLVKRIYNYLHEMNINSSTKVNLEFLEMLAKKFEIPIKYLARDIMGIQLKRYDELCKGIKKSVYPFLGIGYDSPEVSESVYELQKILDERYVGKNITITDIKAMSSHFNIPTSVVLRCALGLDSNAIATLRMYGTCKYKGDKPFVDFPYEQGVKNAARVDLEKFEISTDKTQSGFELSAEDMQDSVLFDSKFYDITASSFDDFMNQIKTKKDLIEKRSRELQEKYDEKYLDIVEFFKSLEITDKNGNTDHSKLVAAKPYIMILKEIILRNPRFVGDGFSKLKLDDFNQICSDICIEPSDVAYKMFGMEKKDYADKIERRRNNSNIGFEIDHPKISSSTINTLMALMGNDFTRALSSISHMICRKYEMNFEGIDGMCLDVLLENGSKFVWSCPNFENIEDYIDAISKYINSCAQNICLAELRSKTKVRSLDEKFSGHSSKQHGEEGRSLLDQIAYIEEGYEQIENGDVEQNIKNMFLSVDGAEIVSEMAKEIIEGKSREEALKAVAEKHNVRIEEIEESLTRIRSSKISEGGEK